MVAVREILGDLYFDGWRQSWVSGKTQYNAKTPFVLHKGTEHQTAASEFGSVGTPSNWPQLNLRPTHPTRKNTRSLNRLNLEGLPKPTRRLNRLNLTAV